MHYPAPDIIANKQGLHLAIECKATKSASQYLEKREVHELRDYALRAGARPLIAVRFFRKEWRFLSPEDLEETQNNYGISQERAQLRGVTFEELTKGL